MEFAMPEQERTERSLEPRREHDFCPRHNDNEEMIGKQGYAIGKHSGQWRMLLIILSVGMGSLLTVVGAAYWNQQQSISIIADSVHSIDKTVTAYMAGHVVEAAEGFRRIQHLELESEKKEHRLDILERYHPEMQR
jgi:hypothetical protein